MGGLFKNIIMNKQEQQKFLSRPADGNVMRLAQALLSGKANIRHQITHAIRHLNKRSFVKDLTMAEVIEALKLISDKDI